MRYANQEAVVMPRARCAFARPHGPPMPRLPSCGPLAPTRKFGLDFTASWPAATAEQANDQRHQEQHGEDEEQDLGDLGRTGGDAAEAEERRDQRNDEEYERIVEHVYRSFRSRDQCRPKSHPRHRSRPGFLTNEILAQSDSPCYRQASLSAVGGAHARVGGHNGWARAVALGPLAVLAVGPRPTPDALRAYLRNRDV